MRKYNYSELEHQINSVLLHQGQELDGIRFGNKASIDERISESEALLKSLGYALPDRVQATASRKPVMVVPSWETLCREAELAVGTDTALEDIFTPEELAENTKAVRLMNQEYNMLHHLDKYDVAISALAGLLGATVDIMLVGIPQKTPKGLSAEKLSDFIRAEFDKKFLLGFIFGVADILTGRMTTIDKSGKIVSQVMEVYADRKESDIFAALAKQIIHFKSDLITSMGLPVPLMSLFNLLQFGSIGEEELTIAEIVQGMYYEGYDFIHFCSMSVPVMLVEVVVRLGYAFKRIKEGHSVKESIPVSLNREKHPKLATMLFIGQAGAAAVNAGKVYFTKNPMAINYPQWVAFAKYSYSQLKWALIQKPAFRDHYVSGLLYEELSVVIVSVDRTFDDFSKDYIVVFE